MSAQQVAPTRMALQTYKGKLLGAKKGYELLKKKSDALKVRCACCASGYGAWHGSERLTIELHGNTWCYLTAEA